MSKPTVGVVVLAILGLGVYSYVFFSADPAPTAAFYAPPPVAPTPGEPRSWEGAMGVGTFTTANLRSGNLLTEIPLVGWSGVGPDIAMVLYHNSALVGWKANSRGTGWKLGPGWTTSYSAQLILSPATNPTSIMAVADDGTQDVYTKVGQNWQAPVGVYDLLTASGSNWKLKHKDQSYHEFNSTGLLLQIVDSSGNAITIQRDAQSRLASVTDAAGRQLIFTPNAANYLQTILDPEDVNNEPTIDNRTFTFSYGNNRVETISDAMSYDVNVRYDASARITSITDKDGDSFSYSYDTDGHLDIVTDPVPIANPSAPRLTQSFDYHVPVAGQSETNYFDRRGSRWRYEYSNELLGVFTNPLGLLRRFEYDGNRNLNSFTDPLSNTWTATYDSAGNMLTLTDPLLHVKTWTYGFGNTLTSYTDAANNTVTLGYTDPSDRTLVTSITEPADGQGNPVAVTELAYFGPNDPASEPGIPPGRWNGLLKEVRDPNDVWTGFEYDVWGQQSFYAEGDFPACGGGAGGGIGSLIPPGPVYYMTQAPDSGSRVGTSSSPATSGTTTHDANNNATGSSCPPFLNFPADPPVPLGFPELCESYTPGRHYGNWTATYSQMGIRRTMTVNLSVNSTAASRDFDATQDEFGLPLTHQVTTDEKGSFTRAFSYSRDLAAGTATRTGPDGVETFAQYDTANRLTYLRRGPQGTPIMEATYSYYADDLLRSVTFGNGTAIEYTYDSARRLITIANANSLGQTMRSISYTYDSRDLPIGVTESTMSGVVATVDFGYDTRGRLISEKRTGESPYKLTYTYDLGGNRREKIDTQNDKRTVYTYDIDAPCDYGSVNNRLVFYQTFDTSGGPGVLESTTWYYYNVEGNVRNIVTENANQPNAFSGTRFIYAKNGRAVTFVAGESWTGGTCDEQSYTVTFAREFRYDGARQRYMNRLLDPAAFRNGSVVEQNSQWSDYDGDEVYGDFSVVDNGGGNPPTVTNLRSFEPGMARNDPWSANGAANSKYYHGDMIGTTRLMSDASGGAASNSGRVFTAFGELVSPTNHAFSDPADRYGYAGSWGYQSHDEFSFQHVGHRYYDPSSGRFLQRDPIGIGGDTNVYAYVDNNPLESVDPSGLFGREGKTGKGGDDPLNKETSAELKKKYDSADKRTKEGKALREKIKRIQKERGERNKQKRDAIKKASKAPLWARLGQYIPAPAPQNVGAYQNACYLVAGSALIGAAGVAAGPIAVPALVPAL